MDPTPIVILCAFIILVIWIVVSYSSKKIQPKNCPKILENYAVSPGVISLTLADNSCPNGVCEFPSFSVTQSISICDAFPICTAFYYDNVSNRMGFVNPKAERTPSGFSDVYVRQTFP